MQHVLHLHVFHLKCGLDIIGNIRHYKPESGTMLITYLSSSPGVLPVIVSG